MLEIGSKIELEIESLASTGNGVGYFEADTTRAIFVPYSVPGDVLEVEIVSQKKVYFEAKILSIIKKSESRRKPVCPHFSICGACDFLHINYDEQFKQKKLILEFLSQKHGVDLGDLELIKAKTEYFYKDKVRTTGNGFYKKKSNEVVPIKKCYIINDKFNEVVFKSTNNKFIFDYKKEEVTTKKGYYYFEDLEIKHHPNGFVQSNITMNNILIEKVLENVFGKEVLELYCGNGNFTLPLVKKGFNVTAIEGDKLGFSLLLENLDRNNLKCVTYNLDVQKYVYDTVKYDTVILDPPRVGSFDVLMNLNCKRVIYVSCNADVSLKEIEKSGFKVIKTILLDMFANTKHFETIFVLEK